MSWWKKDAPKTNVIPFRWTERPDMLEHPRQNAERRLDHLRQNDERWMKPVEPPRERADHRAAFVSSNFQSVDELLWKARQDIRRGLINPTAALIVTYDQDQQRVIWYQFGRENDDADDAFRDWLNEVVLGE